MPSSHGSLNDDGEEFLGGVQGDAHRDEVVSRREDDEDGFDSEEFRAWMREKDRRRRPDRRSRRRDDDESDDDRGGGHKGSGGGQPPEWDGTSVPFQDWLIKARLWLATTRVKARAQGPMILQKLSGQPFQSFKHWAKDPKWLGDEQGGNKLLQAMDTPEFFGEDTEEELLAALAKVTYHLRRHRDESCRQFFTRWDDAVRKIQEHRVELPDKYLGFLLVNALQMSDADIKAMLAFGRGSVAVMDVKNWCRKHEMKLQARDVGVDKKSQGGTGSGRGSMIHYLPEEDDFDEEELYAMEELLREAGPGDDGSTEAAEFETLDNEDILEEHEVKEVLSTMIAQKKKTFLQSLKTKRAKAVARGYGQWRDKGSDKGKGKSSMSTSGFMKGGYYKMTLSEAKAKSRCTKCQQIGHWHKDPECPHNQPGFRNQTKEVNFVMEGTQSEEAIFCGVLDCETAVRKPSTTAAPIDEQATDFECFPGQLRQNQSSSGGPISSEQNGAGSDSISVAYKDPLQNGVGCASLGFDGCLKGEYPILWNETLRNSPGISYTPNEDLCATIDTGCQRMAIGLNTLKRFDQALPEGLQTSIVPQEHRFRSVHGTSTTKYVAAIPTSLGPRGSLLRPAVFENSASRDAPFLISLPFLVFCHSVLHLDPSSKLRVEFRRFKFSAPCHIGPTGSLRVSLANFSSENIRRLNEAQESFQRREKEFEIFRLSSAFGPEKEEPEPNSSSLGFPDCHGEPRNYEASPSGRDGDRERAGLEANGAEATIPGMSHYRHGYSSLDAQGEEQGETLLGMASRGDPGGEGDQRCGEFGKLFHDSVGDRGSYTAVTNPKLWVADHRGTEPCHPGGDRDDGTATDLQSSGSLHPLHDPQAGLQLRKDVLAVPTSTSSTVPLLRMDSGTAQLEGTEGKFNRARKPDHTDLPEGTNYAREEEAPGQVHTLSHYQGGDKRLCDSREVRDLRRGAEERGTSGFRDGVQQIDQDEQVEGQREGDQGEVSPHADQQQDVQGRDGGVRGVPEIPTMADPQTEREQEQFQQDGHGFRRLRAPEEEEAVLEGSTELTKQAKRALHQAEAALRTAEDTWRELMSLVCTESDQVEPTG